MYSFVLLLVVTCLSVLVLGFSPFPLKNARHLFGSNQKSFTVSSSSSSLRSHHRLFHSLSVQGISAAGEEEEQESEEDDEESEEKESGAAEVETTADATIDGQISLIKQGLNISGFLNGSDVRVGIIMARWNADIIQGLYKVSSSII